MKKPRTKLKGVKLLVDAVLDKRIMNTLATKRPAAVRAKYFAFVVKGTDGSYISSLYWWKENLLGDIRKLSPGCKVVRVEIREVTR
jgi:hypothetical protein